MSSPQRRRLVLLLALVLIPSLFLASQNIPPAHGSPGTGLVCITFPSTSGSCPSSPFTIGPVTVGQSFTVGVFVQGSDPMGGFDIFVASNPAFVSPASATLGTLIASPSLTSICVGGSATTGMCTANSANGPGVVEVTTIESSGSNECGNTSPCSGLAFTISYTVVGTIQSTTLFYPTNAACGTSSVASPPNTCVLVSDALGPPLSETIQGTTVTQLTGQDPTSTVVSCSPISAVAYSLTSCAANVMDTSSSNPSVPSGAVTFATNSTGSFNPASGICTLVQGTILASCTVKYYPTVAGHHDITVSYSGDSGHTSSSGSFNLIVSPAPPGTTTTVVQCSPAQIQVNQAASCTAMVTDVSSSPTTPTGTVLFKSNSTGSFNPPSNKCTLVAGNAGTSSCSVAYTPTSQGGQRITGQYVNDNNAHISSVETFDLTVTALPPPTTSVSCSPSSVATNVVSICTASVNDISSNPTTPTGIVQFATNSTGVFMPSNSCTLAAGTIASIGSCSVSYSSTLIGHHLITAAYGGDSTHAPTQGTFNLAVTVHGTTTSVTCSPPSVAVSASTSCVLTVSDTSSSRTAPTGTVSLSTGSTGSFSSTSCALTVSSPGVSICSAKYRPSAVGSGLHTIMASYSGDSTHSPSVGTSSLTVTPPAPTPTAPGPQTIFGLSPIVFYSIIGAVVIILVGLVVVGLRRSGRVSRQ